MMFNDVKFTIKRKSQLLQHSFTEFHITTVIVCYMEQYIFFLFSKLRFIQKVVLGENKDTYFTFMFRE